MDGPSLEATTKSRTKIPVFLVVIKFSLIIHTYRDVDNWAKRSERNSGIEIAP